MPKHFRKYKPDDCCLALGCLKRPVALGRCQTHYARVLYKARYDRATTTSGPTFRRAQPTDIKKLKVQMAQEIDQIKAQKEATKCS